MKASFIALAGLLSFASAAPAAKRQMQDIDVTILQYALTLEHLENAFYRDALNKYDAGAFKSAGLDDSVRERISQISGHEASHVEFLSTALSGAGQTPTAECSYSFGYTDPKSFLAISQVLEGVGVSAYLGAAALITEPAYVTAAGSILTVEARHNAYVRKINGYTPFPSAYDVPLTFNQVYSLASAFITSCPESNPALPVKAFPALTATVDGDMAKLVPADSSILDSDEQLYAIWIGFPENAVGEYNKKTMMVTVPEGFSGQQNIILSKAKTVSDDATVAGPAVVDINSY